MPHMADLETSDAELERTSEATDQNATEDDGSSPQPAIRVKQESLSELHSNSPAE